MKDLKIICRCHWLVHQFYFVDISDPDDPPMARSFSLTVHLRPDYNVFHRIRHAILYVFGYRSRFGAFGETLVSEPEARRMRDWIDEWLAR